MSKSDLLLLAALVVIAPRLPVWASYALCFFYVVMSFWLMQ